MSKLLQFLREVKIELSKVVWPKKEQVVKLTLVVLIFSGIVGVYLGGLDFIFTKLLESVLAR